MDQLTNKLARLYRSSLVVEDKEVEANILHTEEEIRLKFPKEWKRIEARAMNLALGYRQSNI